MSTFSKTWMKSQPSNDSYLIAVPTSTSIALYDSKHGIKHESKHDSKHDSMTIYSQSVISRWTIVNVYRHIPQSDYSVMHLPLTHARNACKSGSLYGS